MRPCRDRLVLVDGHGRGLAVPPSIRQADIFKVSEGGSVAATDDVAVEEPLEIRLAFSQDGRRNIRSVAITMRTPGTISTLPQAFCFRRASYPPPISCRSAIAAPPPAKTACETWWSSR